MSDCLREDVVCTSKAIKLAFPEFAFDKKHFRFESLVDLEIEGAIFGSFTC